MSNPINQQQPNQQAKAQASEAQLRKAQSPNKWAGVVRFFHWGSVLLLVLAWALITLHENSDGTTFINLHRAVGVSFLFWMIARIIARFFSQSPPAIPMPKWQVALAHLTHTLLYLLLLAMPIVGILMTWYAGRSIDMFGLFQLPSFLATDRAQARFYESLHVDIIWTAILVFTALHLAGVIQHQFFKKDHVLNRMK